MLFLFNISMISILLCSLNFLQFDKIHLLDESFNEFHVITTEYCGQFTYVIKNIQPNIDENNNQFFLLHQFGNEYKQYKLSIPDSLNFHRFYIPDIKVKNNRLYLLDFDYLFEYQKFNDSFELQKVHSLPYSFINIILEENRIVLTMSKLGYKNEEISNIYVYKIWEQKDSTFFHYFEPLRNHPLCFSTIKSIDYSGGFYAIPTYDRYSILLYNENFQLVDSIVRKVDKWVEPEENLDIKFSDGTKKIWAYSQAQSIIRNIDFIDKDIMLVSYTVPLNQFEYYFLINEYYQKQIFFDLWVKTKGAWTLAASDLDDSKLDKNALFHPNNYHFLRNYKISNGHLLNTVMFPFELTEEHLNQSNAEIREILYEYYVLNSDRFSILNRKIDIEKIKKLVE